MPPGQYNLERSFLLQIFLCISVVSSFNFEKLVTQPVQLPDEMGNCNEGFFHCNTSTQCVSQKLNCDGIADCDDSSDEWNCENEEDSMFWDHLFPKQPFGRNDDIPSETCYWNTSISCPCRGNEVLCRFQNLETAPNFLPNKEIGILDLTGNNFVSLGEDFFDVLPEMETIVLRFCSIETIHPAAFKKLSAINLETIYLDQNNIRNLPNELFPPLNTVKVLILSGNKINNLLSRTFYNLNLLKELDLRSNEIETLEEDVFRPLTDLEILYLNENKIHLIAPGMFPHLNSLHTLSLANNLIADIERNALPFPHLEHLFLAGNNLVEIKCQTFCHLSKLKGLHLNGNHIETFEKGAFDCLENLTSLILSENQFEAIDDSILKNLTALKYVYFSSFHLCRAATHVRVCEPRGDGISSMYHLLDNKILRISVWIMATVAITGNILVLIGRCCRKNHSNVEHSLYLTHLAVSDLLMGTYLGIIAYADITFRGSYIMYEKTWRHSSICALCGFLSTLSCQSSTFILTLVTWDRFVSVTRPLKTRSYSWSTAAVRLSSMWVTSFLLAAAPLSLFSYFGENFYGSNGVCLSLHIHDPYTKGWEYSAALYICFNMMSLLFISYSYLKMLQSIRDSGGRTRNTLRGRDNLVAGRFAIIVTTDCCCWLPIIAVKLAALYGAKISPSLYAWLAVFVLPINSALNPVLYTLTTSTFKKQFRRYGRPLTPPRRSLRACTEVT